MKLLAALLIAGGLYMAWSQHHATTPPAKTAPPAAAAPSPVVAQSSPSNVFKRPLDRTHDVLNQVREGRDSNRF